jgi:hypothetical protein
MNVRQYSASAFASQPACATARNPVTTPCRPSAFSLRTLFVVVTVVGCWLGYSVNWIRQRHAVSESAVNCGTFVIPVKALSAPGLLWIFGERGVAELSLMLKRSDPEVNRIRRLFPEAVLTFYVEDKGAHPGDFSRGGH